MNSASIIKGILTTPNLWDKSALEGIEQIEISDYSFKSDFISPKLRLGMFVEQCVFQSLTQNSQNRILAKNLQIIENNITLGELDCILIQNDQIIHLEIAYKFYLFDPNTNKNELNCWIGPNRRDSLREKITKLKEKQFPLLYHPKSIENLKELSINVARIEQKVVFKAQLFVPFSEEKRNFKLINEACLSGIYFTKSELPTLKDNSFYFPSKLEWTAIPNQNVNWMNFEHFINEVKLYFTAEKSPMFWSKDRKGTISKCFAVWW